MLEVLDPHENEAATVNSTTSRFVPDTGRRDGRGVSDTANYPHLGILPTLNEVAIIDSVTSTATATRGLEPSSSYMANNATAETANLFTCLSCCIAFITAGEQSHALRIVRCTVN